MICLKTGTQIGSSQWNREGPCRCDNCAEARRPPYTVVIDGVPVLCETPEDVFALVRLCQVSQRGEPA